MSNNNNDDGSDLLNTVLNNLDNGGANAATAADVGGGAGSVISSVDETEESQDLISDVLRQKHGKDHHHQGSIEADGQAEQILEDLLQRQQAKKPWWQKIIDESADPIILCILFLIFQSSALQNTLLRLVPAGMFGGFVTASGITGLKAILFALVYYVLKKLLI